MNNHKNDQHNKNKDDKHASQKNSEGKQDMKTPIEKPTNFKSS